MRWTRGVERSKRTAGTSNRIALDEDAFRDERLPRGMVPFNIQQVGSDVVVTYRERDDGWGTDRPRGWVAIFDSRGRFLARLHHDEALDQPWGVAMAPQDFANSAIIFWWPTMAAADRGVRPVQRKVRGQDARRLGRPHRIDGLWAIAFGDGGIATLGADPTAVRSMPATSLPPRIGERTGCSGTSCPWWRTRPTTSSEGSATEVLNGTEGDSLPHGPILRGTSIVVPL